MLKIITVPRDFWYFKIIVNTTYGIFCTTILSLNSDSS